jgi:uncharacterized protein YecT (DUF1311 family)
MCVARAAVWRQGIIGSSCSMLMARRTAMRTTIQRPITTRRMLAIACAAVAITAVTLASATQPEAAYGAQYAQCMQQAGAVNAAMHDCTSDELKQQDRRLNIAYAGLRRNLLAPAQRALQQAQRDWIRFRNSNCAFVDDPEGGTNARLAAGQCRLRMTAQRAQELEAWMSPRP